MIRGVGGEGGGESDKMLAVRSAGCVPVALI